MRFFENRKDAIEHLKTIAPQDRAVVKYLRLVTRESENPARNLNGGDYDRWLNCHLVTPGLYRAKEDWSAEWPIENYDHMDGYVVVAQEEIANE